MITLYSGTPGSGKSFHAAKDVIRRFRRGGGLIANFPLKVPDGIKPKKELRVSYWDNSEITPQRLAAYALKHHKIGVEGQTLLIVDEAQVIYNCREFGAKDRMDWVKFFSQHRKLGFDVLLIAQNDRMLDRQIRTLIEDEVKHRKLNNFGFGGGMIQLLTFGSTWFIALDYWYGGNKLLMGREIIRYSPKVAAIYDSYRMFDSADGSNSLLDGSANLAGETADPDLRIETLKTARGSPRRFKRFQPAALPDVSEKGSEKDDPGDGPVPCAGGIS